MINQKADIRNMYIESIPFEPDMPITFDAYKLSHYHLHCHDGVLEVLILLSGSAHVKVSFEEFDMKEGDYILVNTGDSHSIYATDTKCEAASLYFNMANYREHIPYLDYVLFAMESFDLVKYKNETQPLRRMIANVLLNLARKQSAPQNSLFCDNLKRSAEELLWIFVNDYDMRNYYNRNWNAGYHKTEKYYKIMKYLYDHYEMKNLMDYIAKNEFYSKSYITHLFKQIGASSFQDVLTYIRLYKSERMLLGSDLPILSIADLCGFSDIKYYTSNFKKWFLYTPSEYRKVFQPEIAKNSLFQPLRVEDFICKMEFLIKNNTEGTSYTAAVNPLSAKAKDDWVRLFEKSSSEPPAHRSATSASESDMVPHQIYIGIDEKTNLRQLISQFPSFREQGFVPSLVIQFQDLSLNLCSDLLQRCSEILLEEDQISSDVEVIIAYTNPRDKTNVSRLLQNHDQLKNLQLKPILMPE
jgi:AraC-like DNA-binding protein